MDRQIVYPGSIPLDTDLLNIQRYTLSAIGSLAQTIFGSTTVANGLVCLPGPGYAVSIGPGTLSMPMTTDSTTFGSLPPDGSSIVKTGVNIDSATVTLGTTPDQGSQLCWLLQASLQEVDDTPLALQYWNAAAPSIPYSGPNNSGTAQNTRRHLAVVFSAKSSAPLPLGTFTVPTPDPGYVGLYAVITWVGSGQVVASDVSTLPTAPFLQYHLPNLTPGFSRVQVITASGTWAVPAAVGLIRVRVVGGGGGGGGGTSSFGGGGGGAGGYAEATIPVVPGQTFAIVVGAGGGSAVPNATGGAGGATQFGPTVNAQGGQGGGSANPDSHGGQGGAGTAGTILLTGGMGTDGATITGAPAGAGGASAFGGGGRGSNGGGPAASGMAPGSGAGGAYGVSSSGGVGAAGIVIVEY